MAVAQWALARVFPAALAQAEVPAVQVEERGAREAEPVVKSEKNLTQQLTQHRAQLAGLHGFVQ